MQSVALSRSGPLALSLSSTIKQGRTVTVRLRRARDQSHPGCRRQRSRGVHRLRGRQQFHRGGNPAGPGERRGEVHRAQLTLTFNEDLDIGPGKLPPASAFTVKADGVEVTVQSVTASPTLDHVHPGSVGHDRCAPDRDRELRRARDRHGHRGHRRQRGRGLRGLPGHQQFHGRQHHPAGPGERRGGYRAASSLTLTFNEDLDIGRAGFPRPAPSPSRPTASRCRCSPCWPVGLTRWFWFCRPTRSARTRS